MSRHKLWTRHADMDGVIATVTMVTEESVWMESSALPGRILRLLVDQPDDYMADSQVGDEVEFLHMSQHPDEKPEA